ncbi:DUF1559 domain-containing protein [Planctomyces sp. SH-PL62]|uniref:DUF1559 family PulG-like putative transporter n=1 Tax=Planctomyces sp. SH-PL62 TaxID=1636152 RepID=UPI00078BDFB0|nr:DUF1559 domain-containing protein [Planctomyces sp. SH-PL62]AMV40615.1 hypothetical protein VT85_24505 [Planctomyces sp. SH-PL62]
MSDFLSQFMTGSLKTRIPYVSRTDWHLFSRRSGYTLVELLVVVGIIGLVASITIPAVQAAREAARRATCGNNLRQLGLALHGYNATYSVFPSACGMPNFEGLNPYYMKQYSVLTQVLPNLDERALYDQLNFDASVEDYYLEPPPDGLGSNPNFTVMSTRLGVALCPSDAGGGASGWGGGVNYRVNLGIDRWPTLLDSPFNGPIMSYRCSPPSATSDGLSQTIMLGEKLRGTAGGARPNPRTAMFKGGAGLPFSAEESLSKCRDRRDAASGFYTTSGLSWFIGTLGHTCYNHVISPNAPDPDCVLPSGNPISGLIGARSNHPSGVQAMMADGSVRFMSSSIQPNVWRALGTRGANDIASGEGQHQ